MPNELILICSVVFIYGAALLGYKFFGKIGLYCISVIATILANIEVTIMINAFGMEQTLGNVLFAVTFLITDILSECEGKKAAQTAVYAGIFCSIFFLVLSQSWMLYTPSATDTIMPSIKAVFSNTPRMILASLVVYAVSQMFDVWLYHNGGILQKRSLAANADFCGLEITVQHLSVRFLTLLFSQHSLSGAHTIFRHLFQFSFQAMLSIFSQVCSIPRLFILQEKFMIKSLMQKPKKHKTFLTVLLNCQDFYCKKLCEYAIILQVILCTTHTYCGVATIPFIQVLPRI